MTPTTKSATPTRWEYLRMDKMRTGGNKLDELGREGWELVGFTRDGTFVFKRPVM